MHVRPSSKKEKINLNCALTIYLLHGCHLYALINEDNVNTFKVIDKNVNTMQYSSEGTFLYLKQSPVVVEGKDIDRSIVRMIRTQYSGYVISDIYQDRDNRAEILNIGVDNTTKRLIILSGIKN